MTPSRARAPIPGHLPVDSYRSTRTDVLDRRASGRPRAADLTFPAPGTRWTPAEVVARGHGSPPPITGRTNRPRRSASGEPSDIARGGPERRELRRQERLPPHLAPAAGQVMRPGSRPPLSGAAE